MTNLVTRKQIVHILTLVLPERKTEDTSVYVKVGCTIVTVLNGNVLTSQQLGQS
jgi:hypothetical protein